MRAPVAVRARIDALRQPILMDSILIFATTALQAVAGLVFWLLAARLQSPDVVGIAASLVSAVVALAFFSQLGFNIATIRVLPHSSSPGSDVATAVVVVAATGVVLGLGYALVAPIFSPALSFLGRSPGLVLVFAVLAAGTAVNLFTDAGFLAARAVSVNLRINGLLMGVLKCALPFLLASWGAFGLFSSVGVASLVAAIASTVALLRRLPRPELWLSPSPELRRATRFAAAGYTASAVDLTPVLLLPLLIIHAQGAAANAVYFVAFQIATLLNSVVYAIAQAMFAEGSRHPEQRRHVARRGGLLLLAATVAGAVVMGVGAPLLLQVFGSSYAEQGTRTLQLLALGGLAVAFNSWSMIRLRLVSDLRAMTLVQLATSGTVLVGAVLLASRGIEWVAVSWCCGYAVGGLCGFAAMWRHRHESAVDPAPSPDPFEEPVHESTPGAVG